MTLKEIFKNMNNPIVTKLIYIRKFLKDDNFVGWSKKYDENFSVLDFNELGELNRDKNLYLIRFDNSSNNGFFALWKQGLTALMFADRYKLTPVIDWTDEKSPYYEKDGFDGKYNPFEYFYEQVSGVSIEDVYKSYNVAFYGKNARGDYYKYMKYGQEGDFETFAHLVKKYYVLRKNIKEKLDEDINSLIGNKKTLAVQVRGVDWGNIKGHPIPPSLEIFVEKIDEAIKNGEFEQIFLATDAEDTVEYISNKYPGKVVVYSDVARAPKGSKTLAIFDSSIKRENNGFLLGYEVLRDVQTLSSCQGLIASYSNVSFATEVTKKSWGEDFEYKYIINAKINENGVSGQEACNLQRQGKFNG